MYLFSLWEKGLNSFWWLIDIQLFTKIWLSSYKIKDYNINASNPHSILIVQIEVQQFLHIEYSHDLIESN